MQRVKAGFTSLGKIIKGGNKSEENDNDQDSKSEEELSNEAKSCMGRMPWKRNTTEPIKQKKVDEQIKKDDDFIEPPSEEIKEKAGKYTGKLSKNMSNFRGEFEKKIKGHPECFAEDQSEKTDLTEVSQAAIEHSKDAATSAVNLLNKFKLDDVLKDMSEDSKSGDCVERLERLIKTGLEKNTKFSGLDHEAMAKDIMASLLTYGSVCYAGVLARKAEKDPNGSANAGEEIRVQLRVAQLGVNVHAEKSKNMAAMTERWIPKADASRRDEERKRKQQNRDLVALLTEIQNKEKVSKGKKNNLSEDESLGQKMDVSQKTSIPPVYIPESSSLGNKVSNAVKFTDKNNQEPESNSNQSIQPKKSSQSNESKGATSSESADENSSSESQ